MDQQRAPDEACVRRDLSARAGGFLAVWGAPVLAGLIVSFAGPPITWAAGAWALALAWMGAACLYNARCCGRVHCYVSGPNLLAGAIAAMAVAQGVLQVELDVVVIGALAMFAASYLLELRWGRYRG
jgi:hypothetical protein